MEEKAYFLKGKLSYFRGFVNEDYELIAKCINDPIFNKLLFQGTKPVNAETVKKQIESEDEERSIQLVQCDILNDQLVGWCGLYPIRRIELSADMRSFIFPSYWSKGFGTEQHAALIKIGFEKLNLNRITTGTNEENIGMLSVYKKLGLTKEGIFRQDHYKNGKYSDTIHYAVLRNEYENKVKELCNLFLF